VALSPGRLVRQLTKLLVLTSCRSQERKADVARGRTVGTCTRAKTRKCLVASKRVLASIISPSPRRTVHKALADGPAVPIIPSTRPSNASVAAGLFNLAMAYYCLIVLLTTAAVLLGPNFASKVFDSPGILSSFHTLSTLNTHVRPRAPSSTIHSYPVGHTHLLVASRPSSMATIDTPYIAHTTTH
jgi:hypothetical protein